MQYLPLNENYCKSEAGEEQEAEEPDKLYCYSKRAYKTSQGNCCGYSANFSPSVDYSRSSTRDRETKEMLDVVCS